MKKMIIQALCVLIALFMLVLFFRYFERNSVFYPMKRIEFLPSDAGLACEDVYFTTRDGIKLNGWFMPAKDSKAIILFFHGNAGNISHRIEVIEMLNQIGLSVFIFDYRGYGKSEGRPSEKGTYLDSQAAYDYLASRPDLAKKNIVLYGESIGGAVAINLALEKKAKALITEGVFTSAKDVAKDIYAFIPIWLFLSIKYDSLSKIEKITIPKLIIHSIDDEIISFRHARRLFDAAKEPKELCQMRGGHNYAILLGKEKFKETISKFINKYILKSSKK